MDGGRIRIFKVELHRKEGKYNKEGNNCMCTICAGFCDFEWFPDRPKNNYPTVGVENMSSTTARMYFISRPDIDDPDTPIFYIDENIHIHENDETLTLKSGEYNLVNKNGEINYQGNNYTYNSYIDVPYVQ